MKTQKYFPWAGFLATGFLLLLFYFSCAGWAAEAKYPRKPVQVVIAYQPGATDMAFRPFTDKTPAYLGQQMSFVFKPGGTGAIGASYVAKAEPDGYTLFGTTRGPVLLAPLTMEGLDYKPEDFVPIVRLARSPQIIAVKADSPYKTIKNIVDEAKKFPQKLTYSHSGIYGSSHLPVEMFIKKAGIRIKHVPTGGSGPSVTALLGGHVTIASSTFAPLAPHFKSGALIPIGVFEERRLKELPNVPTFQEAGYPVIFYTWYGLMAPKGVPEEVRQTLYAAFRKVLEDHRNYVEDRLSKMALTLDFMSPQDFARDLKQEYETMKNLLPDLKKAIQ